ncbi:hypothetical protein ACJJTC_016239 [Scirpophaga incertulas]
MSIGKLSEFDVKCGAWSSYIDRLKYVLQTELSFNSVNEMMQSHLQPTPSALAERYRFRQRRQNVGENISLYVAELKKLAKHCKFGGNLNENLRDSISFCGLRSDIIRQRLFAEDDTVTFTSAFKLATSLEAAERDAAVVEAPTTSTGARRNRLD